jgi:hypothetical protein
MTHGAQGGELAADTPQQRLSARPPRIELAHVQERSKLRLRQVDAQAAERVSHAERLIDLSAENACLRAGQGDGFWAPLLRSDPVCVT